MKRTILILAALAFLIVKNQAQTVTDYDGNVYNEVTIGTQIWMKENLKVTHFNNGEIVPNVLDGFEWSTLTTGARCYYDNDSATHAQVYGALYNWFTVADSRKLCPTGWHVPGDSEWNILEIYLDHSVDTTAMQWVGTDIGGKLKEAGTTHWSSPNIGSTNTSGFSALPAGGRGFNGMYGGKGELEDWWTATIYDDTSAMKRYLYYYSAQIERSNWYKTCGWSVRCIMDSVATLIDESSIDLRLHIYPNPALDFIKISGYNESHGYLTISEITGKRILSQRYERESKINVSEFENGVYFLHIKSANNTVTGKFIIMR